MVVSDNPQPKLGSTFELSSIPQLDALATSTGLSISLISRIMSGNRFPSAYSAAQLAKAIKVTLPEFFGIRERVIKAGGMAKIHPVTMTVHEE